MKTVLKKISKALLIVPVLMASFLLTAQPVMAQEGCDDVSKGIAVGAGCARPEQAPSELFGPQGVFVTVTNILLFVIGAIAVIMLIIGGIRYVVSSGDQTAVTNAKNTILYAIIGIIVAFLAYAAVNFISTQLIKGSPATTSTQSRLV